MSFNIPNSFDPFRRSHEHDSGVSADAVLVETGHEPTAGFNIAAYNRQISTAAAEFNLLDLVGGDV